MRAPVTGANVINEEIIQPSPASLLYLHCNIGNTKVGCDTDGQQEVKDGRLDPAIKNKRIKLLREVLPERETTAQQAKGNSSPVCVHHLLQLVIENKLRVPVRRRNSSEGVTLLDSTDRSA